MTRTVSEAVVDGKGFKMVKKLLVLMAALALFSGTAWADGEIESKEMLNQPGRRIGISQGSAAEAAVMAELPQADIVYYTDNLLGYTAVAQGKIDAYVFDRIQMQLAIDNGMSGVHLLPELMDQTVRIAVGYSDVSAIPNLGDSLNRFIAELKADGTLDDMYRRWVLEEKDVMPQIPMAGNPQTILVVGTTGNVPPYSYYEGNGLTGFDIELAHRFAAWLGTGLSFDIYDFDGIIPAAKSGKIDVIMSNLQYLPERAEGLPFSDILYEERMGILVRGSAAPGSTPSEGAAGRAAEDLSFMEDVKSSFNRTFIRENRWELFARGIFTTLQITVLSILFGTALGFCVFMLCRNGNPAANLITRFIMRLVQGMPVVVLLMILYYIIFGSITVSGIFVAVIGFTLTFGVAVFGLLKMGVGAVDNGQYEAAYALGYSNRRTFFRIILPQALPHVLPSYRSEVVSLIKATAIVGYIAVQDLTKMGDIVRSRTYEAFFPLISIAVIYFALEGLLGFLVGSIGRSSNPRRRKPADILRGVTTDD